jgi:hypothetical protein
MLLVTATWKIPYHLRHSEKVKLTFNGDPAITSKWNDIYWFHGRCKKYLDGAPLLFANGRGEHFMLDIWGVFSKFEDIQTYYKYGSYIRRDALDFETQYNYTMQIIPWGESEEIEYEPSRTRLLPAYQSNTTVYRRSPRYYKCQPMNHKRKPSRIAMWMPTSECPRS